MRANKIKVGMRVWWSDPDKSNPDLDCSGLGTVMHVQHNPPVSDSVIEILKDDDGYLEAFPCELKEHGK